MKNHQLANGKLLQTNKKFSHLKIKQKEQITQWLYEAYRRNVLTSGKPPSGKTDASIITWVMEKITDAGIWIPEGEIAAYYYSRKTHFYKRLVKENNFCDMTGLSEDEMDAALEKGYSDYISDRCKIAKEVFAQLRNRFITPD